MLTDMLGNVDAFWNCGSQAARVRSDSVQLRFSGRYIQSLVLYLFSTLLLSEVGFDLLRCL